MKTKNEKPKMKNEKWKTKNNKTKNQKTKNEKRTMKNEQWKTTFFLIKGVLGSKNLLSKSWSERQIPYDSRPRRPFWGPLLAILDFAGGERVPLAPLDWYWHHIQYNSKWGLFSGWNWFDLLRAIYSNNAVLIWFPQIIN